MSKHSINGIEYETIIEPSTRIDSYLQSLDGLIENLPDNHKAGLQMAREVARIWFRDEVAALGEARVTSK